MPITLAIVKIIQSHFSIDIDHQLLPEAPSRVEFGLSDAVSLLRSPGIK